MYCLMSKVGGEVSAEVENHLKIHPNVRQIYFGTGSADCVEVL